MSAPEKPVPFVYERAIFWGDTDTAQIVYTGKFVDYMFEAIESFMRDRLGTDWFLQTVDEQRGGPIARLELDFHARVSPRDTLSVQVFLDRVGVSAVTFRVEGYIDGTTHAFTGRCVSVGYDYAAQSKMPIRPDRRAVLEAYKAACDAL
jgi:acyl-CoA thioesterase FadM